MIISSGHGEDIAPHMKGVAFMLSKEATKSLIEWEPVSSRTIKTRFHNKVQRVTVIQCYTTANDAQEDCKNAFYERLQAEIDKQAKRDVALLMGDFNAKIGSDNTGQEQSMGKHGLVEMNENGEVFSDFCAFNNMIIGRSVYPHKRVYKVTWGSPNHATKHQIDHICISHRFRRSLLDVRLGGGANAASNHHLITGEFQFKLKAAFNKGAMRTSH